VFKKCRDALHGLVGQLIERGLPQFSADRVPPFHGIRTKPVFAQTLQGIEKVALLPEGD